MTDESSKALLVIPGAGAGNTELSPNRRPPLQHGCAWDPKLFRSLWEVRIVVVVVVVKAIVVVVLVVVVVVAVGVSTMPESW